MDQKADKSRVAPKRQPQPNLFALLRPYARWVSALVLLTVLANGLNLLVPKLIAGAIDAYDAGHFAPLSLAIEFFAATAAIFVFTYFQAVVQTLASERVARDLRSRLIAKISLHDYAFIQQVTPAKLLTNLTSDIDAVKNFVAQAIASIISSLFLIVGASVLLLITDWQLALLVLLVIPIIGGTFFFVLTRVRKLFRKVQEALDWLNKVINESIVGAALIRLLDSHGFEFEKFVAANTEARNLGYSIIRLFSGLIPVITFAASLATLAILVLGGHFVITGQMTLGDFTAFNSYLAILIFPIIIIGFMSNVIAQAQASYGRVSQVLDAPVTKAVGKIKAPIRGDVAVDNLTIKYGEKAALSGVSFVARAGSRTAIIGPTAAGKTQLLYAMTGLIRPTVGQVTYDGQPIDAFDKQSLYRQLGIVFQDSVLFNLSLRENIAFSDKVDDRSLDKAIATAELADFIATLPQGLDTVVSERGTSLSGGQKQRIMLARALALDPRVLLLDDFTARVDTRTERRILANVRQNYPELTLISVTQKIAPVEDYDQIVLLMEGLVLAIGTHAELMQTSPEYVQIYRSQQSTEDYELQA
ncbi:MAG TPA: ABC transporter ATP-binding protein [Devosiaceae bacterium]|nr:ABC transporter ATP-binding protein [Devosiaceae bacterium]